MARHIARGAAKDHTPGQIGRLAPQLAVDEIGTTAQAQRQRSTDHSKVGDGPGVELIHAAHDDAAQDAAHQAAMEAHTSLVGGKDLERVGPIVAIAIKDDIKQARADDEAKDRADHDTRQVINRNVEAPTALRAVHNNRREQSADHVGQTIPVNGDGARRDRDGIKHMVEVVEHIDPLLPTYKCGRGPCARSRISGRNVYAERTVRSFRILERRVLVVQVLGLAGSIDLLNAGNAGHMLLQDALDTHGKG